MQQAKAILADATLLKALQLLIHQAGEAILEAEVVSALELVLGLLYLQVYGVVLHKFEKFAQHLEGGEVFGFAYVYLLEHGQRFVEKVLELSFVKIWTEFIEKLLDGHVLAYVDVLFSLELVQSFVHCSSIG